MTLRAHLPVIVYALLVVVLSCKRKPAGLRIIAEVLRSVTRRVTRRRSAGGLQGSGVFGTTPRQFGFGAQNRLLQKWSSQVKQRKQKEGRSSRHQGVEFTEKWDSVHPTTCCVWRRTPIERSLRPELENTQRKIVTKDEVDAINWECTESHTASESACNMHA